MSEGKPGAGKASARLSGVEPFGPVPEQVDHGAPVARDLAVVLRLAQDSNLAAGGGISLLDLCAEGPGGNPQGEPNGARP